MLEVHEKAIHAKLVSEQYNGNFPSTFEELIKLPSPISEFLGVAVIGTILYIGGRLVLVEQSMSGEEFITYMTLAYGVLTPEERSILEIKTTPCTCVR